MLGGSASDRGWLPSLVFGEAVPAGIMNAQIRASGQSKPPVAKPIQLAAFTAAACGCPHFRASWPGAFPKLTMTTTAATMSTAKTTNANASKTPNEDSILGCSLIRLLGAALILFVDAISGSIQRTLAVTPCRRT
jgi:hypothetical protein